MKKLRNILVPTDFSPSARQALAYGLGLARRSAATLHLMHVMNPVEGDSFSPLKYTPEAHALHKSHDASIYELLETALSEFDTEGLEVELVKRRGMRMSEPILAYAKKEEVDLIVMGTHGRRGIKHLLMGSVASDVVRHAPCDVMAVHEKPTHEENNIERILACVDFSPHSDAVLKQAHALAAGYHARLDLLHVVEPLAFPVSLTGICTIYDIVPDLQGKVEERLDKLVSGVEKPEVDIETHITDGHAAHTIIEFAEELDANLIVMATHGLSGLDRFLLGSVTSRVIRLAPCPVFVVKSEHMDREAPAEEQAVDFSGIGLA